MRTSLILAASILLSSTTAVANPVPTVQELRAQALAGPHVKLTYAFNYGPEPDGATTHGTSHSPWVEADLSHRSFGSKSYSLANREMCDCHVPSGTTLDYYLVFEGGYGLSVTARVSAPDPTLPVTVNDCTTPCQLADAAAADAGLGGTGGAPGPTTPEKAETGGCALLTSGASPVLLCLALLGLGIAARRRRP